MSFSNSNYDPTARRRSSVGFRIFNNMFPPVFLPNEPEADADVLPRSQDILYAHQLASPNPYVLDENAFMIAAACAREKQSREIYKALKKNGVITPDGGIDTTRITNKFKHELSFLSTRGQRAVIGILFWWEEQVQRLRKLEAEERELASMICQAEAHGTTSDRQLLDQLKFARERVRLKIRQRPTERSADLENDTDMLLERSFSAGQNTSNGDERPPAYTAARG